MKVARTGATDATPDTSFRLRLHSELARRCARNRLYSLRAFAHQLGVDASTLSQWLRGRRPLTAKTITSIGSQLGLSSEEIGRYVEHEARHTGLTPSDSVLAADTAALIAEWHHFAILELVALDAFRPDSRWVANVLGISVDDVNIALQRLLHLGLLDMRSPRLWVDRSGDAVLDLRALDAATLNRMRVTLLERALAAVARQPSALQDHSAVTVAINAAMVPRAVELIAKFRQQLLELLRQGPADDIYQLDIGLFPLTSQRRTLHDGTGN
jgi:transcriptional regulator with XRE-family HTH domain